MTIKPICSSMVKKDLVLEVLSITLEIVDKNKRFPSIFLKILHCTLPVIKRKILSVSVSEIIKSKDHP